MRTLVATDFSTTSDEALRQALARWQSLGGTVALCHVTPTIAQIQGLMSADAPVELAGQLATGHELRAAVREQIRRVAPGNNEEFELLVAEGPAYAGIVDQAERWRADSIAIGSGGATGIERWLLGSVASRVVRYAHCPVLIARPTAAKAVLVATDLSDPSLPAIAAGAREARSRQASRLVVLHVEDVSNVVMTPAFMGAEPVVLPESLLAKRREAAQMLIQGALERFEAQAEVQVVDGDAATEILRLASELPAELLVVGTRGRTGLSRVLLGSVAERLVRDAPCSVLAVRLATN